MENENRSVRSHDAEPDSARVNVTEQTKPQRSSRKTLLIAVIVSVITIGALVTLRGQSNALHSGAVTLDHETPALHDNATNPGGINGVEGNSPLAARPSETIMRAIEGVSDRINQWFESLRTEQASANRGLSSLSASMSEIHESIAELRKGSDELKQHIIEAQSKLQAIAQDVHGLKVATKKKTVVQHKQAARVPPFHVDAIDLWDAAVYVAISQNGRTAFLREGQQQSGWRVTHIDRLKEQITFLGPEGQDYSASLGR